MRRVICPVMSRESLSRIVSQFNTDTWTVGSDGFVPFGGRIRMVESVQAEGAILNGSNAARYAFPNATPGVGVQGNQAQLRWGEAVRGTAIVRMRMDLPS